MAADDFARSSDKLAGGVGQLLALLFEVGIDEALVVAAGNEADLLRIRLIGQRESMLLREHAHLRLRHVAKRKKRAAELLLRETEEEIALVLGQIMTAQQQPASALFGVLDACVVAG